MNIFVGNLPFRTAENELRRLFEQYGEVARANIITDRMTGQSRGFGFVQMESRDQARDAIDKLNGQQFNGRAIVVNEAKPRENIGNLRTSGNSRDFNRGGSRGYRDSDDRY